jgi:DNA-binding NarL/FixJ family response regulator
MSTQDVLFSVLALNDEVRKHILTLLKESARPSVGIANLDDLMESVKAANNAIIFVDSEAVTAYGAGMVSKLKMACRECRLIVLCSLNHRNLVKPVMELGAYGCIMEPYPEWEFTAMVKPILVDFKDEKAKALKGKRQGRKSQAD